MDKLIDIITEFAGTNERMDSIVLQDEEYNALMEEIDEKCKKIKRRIDSTRLGIL